MSFWLAAPAVSIATASLEKPATTTSWMKCIRILCLTPEKARLNESRGAEGGAEDVDAVVVKPLAAAVRVRVVPQGASVRDAVHLEDERRVSGGGL